MGTFRTRTGSECCGETRGLGSKGNEWEDLIIACGDSGFLVSFISICVHERRAEEGAAPRGIYAGDNRPVGAARDTSRGRAEGRRGLMHELRGRGWHWR